MKWIWIGFVVFMIWVAITMPILEWAVTLPLGTYMLVFSGWMFGSLAVLVSFLIRRF